MATRRGHGPGLQVHLFLGGGGGTSETHSTSQPCDRWSQLLAQAVWRVLGSLLSITAPEHSAVFVTWLLAMPSHRPSAPLCSLRAAQPWGVEGASGKQSQSPPQNGCSWQDSSQSNRPRFSPDHCDQEILPPCLLQVPPLNGWYVPRALLSRWGSVIFGVPVAHCADSSCKRSSSWSPETQAVFTLIASAFFF